MVAMFQLQIGEKCGLKASFPNPGDDEKIRDIFRKDIELNNLGIGAPMVGSEINFSYPISIFAGNKQV